MRFEFCYVLCIYNTYTRVELIAVLRDYVRHFLAFYQDNQDNR